ncbi:MAG: Ig-like domain-containing protein [Patescibacteria group bacterium]|jgi:hypothetical protein
MLIRKKITAFIFSLVSVIFLLPNIVLAQTDEFGRNSLGGLAIASSRSLFDMVVGIVNTILYFLGGIAVLLFMYAGWLWFTSQGNSEKITKAKKIMMSVVIGLAIIFSSYAAVNWIFKEAIRTILDADGGVGGGGGRYGGGVGLGAGVIESHYPEPNATSIPRNTNIYITFKEPMMVNTIVDAGSTDCAGTNPRTCPINTDNILLHKANTTDNLDNMTVTYDPGDPRVFEFNPYGTATTDPYLLGEQTKDTKYQMSLRNLRTSDDRQAFSFNSYSWYFTVGTYSDNTAPRVVSVRPRLNATSPRNTIVQINFSEPVNPTLATGSTIAPSTYNNITLTHGAANTMAIGKYVISNQYRTVEFIPNELCGENFCGLDIFCLAGGESFIGTVTTNIRDMAGNAIASNYVWNFRTTDNIDLDPPVMVNMIPTGDETQLSQIVQMTFNKTLLSSSVNSSNVKLFEGVNTPINYWLRLSDANSLDNNVINIRHERFAVSTNYLATSTSGIMDENQNCWYPCRCQGANCQCDTPGACSGSSCVTPVP